jgi:hypothetical protein
MIHIGTYNTLSVLKTVDFGVYLDGGNGVEILLPSRYITTPLQIGDEIRVFVYTDSEDRLIATTEAPLITVGEFAFLNVVDVNRVGAFLDWGLPKDLLCPFREQRSTMEKGGRYLVYAYLDDSSKRIVASNKIEKFIGNKFPDYHTGEAVKVLVYQHTEIGYKTIVDNLYYGMLYTNEVYRNIEIGESLDVYVKTVRDDGKIDLSLQVPGTRNRIDVLAEQLISYLRDNGGQTTLCDNSTPEEIRAVFACSKKDFKKTVGMLYKQHRIAVSPLGIRLL